MLPRRCILYCDTSITRSWHGQCVSSSALKAAPSWRAGSLNGSLRCGRISSFTGNSVWSGCLPDGSRVRRESHARFCERPVVKFHRPTQPFRWDRDLYGSDRRYLNVEPSKKALQRERDRISELTDRSQGCTPIPRLIGRLNRQLKGWANYFSLGYPRKAYRNINWRLGYRLANHLKHHRSQRPYQLPAGMSYYEHLQRLGLEFLTAKPRDSRRRGFSGVPDAANLHVRFDEGTVSRANRRSLSYSTGRQCSAAFFAASLTASQRALAAA